MPSAPNPPRPQGIVHAQTDRGLRVHNEDASAISSTNGLVGAWTGPIDLNGGWALLADGMGGHAAGEVASTLALTVLRPLMPGLRQEADIHRAIEQADSALYLAMSMRPELIGMGTTVAGTIFLGDHALIFNVGDSRIYAFAEGELQLLTTDDVVEGNLLTQCLGGMQGQVPLSPHCVLHPMQSGSMLLMCSDGLTDVVSDDQIRSMLAGRPANPAKLLVAAALEAGGYDNVSVIVVSA